MTPDQLATLAAELHGDPKGRGYAVHLPDDPVRVVELLNAQTEHMIKSRFITERGIMSRCTDGNAILDRLEELAPDNSAIRRALKFLGQEAGLDVGDAYTQGMINELVSQGGLSADWGSQLKNLALQPASPGEVLGLSGVTVQDVLKAWSAE